MADEGRDKQENGGKVSRELKYQQNKKVWKEPKWFWAPNITGQQELSVIDMIEIFFFFIFNLFYEARSHLQKQLCCLQSLPSSSQGNNKFFEGTALGLHDFCVLLLTGKGTNSYRVRQTMFTSLRGRINPRLFDFQTQNYIVHFYLSYHSSNKPASWGFYASL